MNEQQNMDMSREKDHRVTESFNQSQQTKRLEDLMYQRMKNRERQRRYRERKRLLADTNKSVKMNEPTPLPLPMPSPPPSPDTSSAIVPYQRPNRVHCTRDWKKDARRAHTVKQEITNATPQHNQYVTHGNQVLEYKSKDESSTNPSGLENSDTSKSKSARRAWKAEARGKKGETKCS